MAEPKPIIINNFQKGIAQSSYLGFEEIRNLNITDKPGVCYPHRALVKESASTVTDALYGMTKDSVGDIWGYSKLVGNKVFKRNGTWAEVTNHTNDVMFGIQYWKSYVAVLYTSTIDWYKISDNSCDQTWGAILTSYVATSPHVIKPLLHSKNDDKLYIGSGRVLDTIEEIDGQNFDPGDADPTATGDQNSTCTVTKAVFTLPEGYTIVSLVELGEKLYIGTIKEGTGIESAIFVWDRVNTDSLYDNIVELKDESIYTMITVNNFIYIQGAKGRWYRSNGVSVQLIAKIPFTLIDLATSSFVIYPNSIAYLNGLIYFGVSSTDSGKVPQAVWSLNPDTFALNVEYTISPGEDGTNDGILIPSLMAIGGTSSNLLVPWFDENGSAYGVDDIGSARYTGDKAFFISQFYRVGTRLNPRTFNDFEVQLSKPQAAGDSVKVYYRTAQNGSWTQIGATWDTDAEQDYSFQRALSVANIQFKIVLNDEAELLEFRAN